MSQPSPARRASSSRSHLGVVKTPSARSASGAAPGALLRVNQEGMCLHVEPFGQFDPMPAASGLLGTNLRAALPRELAAVVLDDLREGGLGRRSREVSVGGYRMRVEISPTRDGTSWVRFRTLGPIGLTGAPGPARSAGRDDRHAATAVRPAGPQVERPEATGSARVHLDRDGRIVDWNAAAAYATGLTADAAVGRHLASLSVDDHNGPWAALVEHQLNAPPDGPSEGRGWIWHADGTRRWVAVSVTSVPSGHSASLRDLTQRRLRDSRAAAPLRRWTRGPGRTRRR